MRGRHHEGAGHDAPHHAIKARQALPLDDPEDLSLRGMRVLADLAQRRQFLEPRGEPCRRAREARR